MDTTIHVIAITAASGADVLRISDAGTETLLQGAAAGDSVEEDWSETEVPVDGSQDSDFLRVAGFPAMLAFREDLLARTGLELYLEGGEFLPVLTSRGRMVLWHLLAGQVINCEARDSQSAAPVFLRHRLPGSCSLFSTPRLCSSELLVQAHGAELPPALGGPAEAAHPPVDSRPEDWRSFPLEYTWREWTGLEFRVMWQDHR